MNAPPNLSAAVQLLALFVFGVLSSLANAQGGAVQIKLLEAASSGKLLIEVRNTGVREITIVDPNTERTSAAVAIDLFDLDGHKIGRFRRPFNAWQDGVFLPVVRIKSGEAYRFSVLIGAFNFDGLSTTPARKAPSAAAVAFDLASIGLDQRNGFYEGELLTEGFAIKQSFVPVGKKLIGGTGAKK